MQEKIFKVKNFEVTHKSVKSVKVFSLEIFRLYGTLLDNQNADGWTNKQTAFYLYIVGPYLFDFMLHGPNIFQYELIRVVGQFEKIFITCKTVP